MTKYLRWLLLPFSLVYGLVVIMRNWLYDAGIFTSRTFNLPVIAVGNLDVGGAGKTPMTEYLVRLLKDDHKLATLSRGYGRQTKGFLTATATSITATELGDEPSQFHQKFPGITVAVSEKRAWGIEQLMNDHEVIVLDDAYQHRAVNPGFKILLLDYNRLNDPKLLLPAGNLREPFIGRYRADVMVVSKCPAGLTQAQQQKALEVLLPLHYQQVYFTGITYLPLQNLEGQPVSKNIDSHTTVFLLTGIANAQPLLSYIKEHTLHVIHHNYPDHHQFSIKNIAKLAKDFNGCKAPKKVIITTEKDAQRLYEPQLLPQVKALPIWVLPIGIQFLNQQQQQFNNTIYNYVKQYKTYRRLY
ncbi:tetraacyldisaccharide 4'-kinase [Mucilaginibacter terrae]|uniref:tetraacyldisaccharide 4'-kinase n=1 Tax=Mucilaginibacter terrae TaxID=1955052 RepID=UPI00363CF7E3